MVQVTTVTAERIVREQAKIMLQLIKTVKYAVDNPIALKVPKLDPQSHKVVGFSDSPFDNNQDLITQLGHIVFVADISGNSFTTHFKSYKSKRAVRSAISVDLIAFSNMFDVSATLGAELECILGHKPQFIYLQTLCPTLT